jgi:hypothetical protein
MRFLPRRDEVPGWQFADDPLVIPPDRLAERIGDDANHFLGYGVVDVTVGDYRRVDGGGFAVVEIFRFPDFIKAFGAYSTRRKAVRETLDIPNESFAGPRSVHIWRGPFYIRIIGGGSEAAQAGLVDLARAAVQNMPPAPARPAVFRFLPEANRVPNSEAFNAVEAFGQPVLRNSFTATFIVDGQPVEGLVLPASSREAATTVLNHYRNFFVVNGRMLDPVPNLGEGNFTAEDRFFGRTIAFRIDRFLIAFRGFVDHKSLLDIAIATDQRIIGTIRTQLREEEKRAQAAARPQATPPREEPDWVQPGQQ